MICETTFYLDFSATLDAQPIGGGTLIQGELDIARASLHCEELTRFCFRKICAQPGNGQTLNTNRKVRAKIPATKVCDDVSKFVDSQNPPEQFIALGPRNRQRNSHEIHNPRTDQIDRHAVRDIRRHRRKNIPAMKRLADRAQEEVLIGDVVDLVLQNRRKYSVISADKNLVVLYRNDRAPRRSNAGIDNDNVNGALRKISIGVFDEEGAFDDVV